MKRKIFIIGDSHTDALKRALKNHECPWNENLEITALRYSRIKEDKAIGDVTEKEILDIAATMSGTDVLVSTIGGNQHQVVALMQHPLSFDLLLQTSPTENISAIEAAKVIPYNLLFDYFWQGISTGRDGSRLRALKDSTEAKVIHLIPPPPKKNSEFILKHHETHFAKAGISNTGISPANLRLNVWRLQCDVLKKLSIEVGIELLPPPANTLDDQGYLAEKYYANDATHANAFYGELVINQIIGHVSEGASYD